MPFRTTDDHARMPASSQILQARFGDLRCPRRFRSVFCVFPKVTQLDFTGPLQVFSSVPGAKVHLIWKRIEPVAERLRADADADHHFRRLSAARRDLRARRRSAPTTWSMTRRCWLSCASRPKAPNTSPRSARDRWCWAPPACSKAIAPRRTGPRWIFSPPFGATPTRTRVCVDRNRVTGGGVTAGIDFALTLVSLLVDRQTAEAIQLRLEYNPAPPFNSGSPDTAPPEVLAFMKERIAPRKPAAAK